MELRLARTMRVLAEKMAMGIPVKAICMQELYPMLFTGGTGVVLGGERGRQGATWRNKGMDILL